MKKKPPRATTRWNETVPDEVLAAGVDPSSIFRIDETPTAWRVVLNKASTLVIPKLAREGHA